MKIKLKPKRVVRAPKKISEELFWEVASHECDPAKSLKITHQIDQAIREHEKNIYGSRSLANNNEAWIAGITRWMIAGPGLHFSLALVSH